MFFISFYLIMSGALSFEFSELKLVERIIEDVSDIWKSQCTFLVKSPSYTRPETHQLLNLQKRLTTNMRSHRTQVLSYTFDLFNPHGRAFKSCEKSINVIMVSNGTKDEVEKFSQKFQFKPSTWIFFMNSSVEAFFERINLNVASNVLATKMGRSNNVDLSEVFKIAGDYPVLTRPSGVYSNTIGGVSTPPNFAAEMRSDLKGIKFTAVSIEDWPITSFVHGEAIRAGKTIDGFFGRIWTDLENQMNFTTEIKRVNEEESFRVISNGLFMDVDFFLAELTVTRDRLDNLDYFLPLVKSYMQVYFRKHGFKIDWKVIVRPFGTDVWIAIAFWAVFATMAMFLASTLLKSHGLDQNDNSIFATPVQSFLFVLQTISFQGSFRVPRSGSVRILFLLSYLFVTVLLPFYSASLISSLTKKEPLKPFNKLHDLFKSDFKLLVWRDTSDEEFFSSSDDPTLQSIYRNQVLLRNNTMLDGYTGLYKEMCQTPLSAMFAVESSMDAIAEKFRSCSVVKFSSPVSPMFETIAVRKGSPYREGIGYNLLRLGEVGCLNRYRRLYMRPKSSADKPDNDILVTEYDVAATFCLLLVGMLISVLILAIEIFIEQGNKQY